MLECYILKKWKILAKSFDFLNSQHATCTYSMWYVLSQFLWLNQKSLATARGRHTQVSCASLLSAILDVAFSNTVIGWGSLSRLWQNRMQMFQLLHYLNPLHYLWPRQGWAKPCRLPEKKHLKTEVTGIHSPMNSN